MRLWQYILYVSVVSMLSWYGYHWVEAGWVAFRKAEYAFEDHNYNRAVTYYIKAVRHKMRSQELCEHLATASLYAKRQQDAIDAFEEVIKQSPNNFCAYDILACFYVDIDQWKKAIDVYERAIQALPEKKIIFPYLINLLLMKGRYDQVLNLYEVAFSKYGVRDFSLLLEYTHILMRAGYYDKAEQTYLNIIKQYPDFFAAKIDLMNLFVLTKQYQKALHFLQQIDKNKLDDSWLITKGDMYLALNQREKAKGSYLEYLDKHARNTQVLLKLAECYSEDHEYLKAEEIWEKIYKLNSKDVQIQRKYGLFLVLVKKYEMAAKILKKSLENPEKSSSLLDVDVWIDEDEAKLLLARSLAMNPESRKEALQIYEELIKEHPRNTLIRTELGSLHYSLKDYENSEKELKKVLENEPDNEEALDLLGKQFIVNERYTEAIDIYEHLHKIFPDNIRYIENLAFTYHNMHLYRSAIDNYKFLAERTRRPKKEILTMMADCYISLGKLSEAEYWYRIAHKRYPRSRRIQIKLGEILIWENKNEEALRILSPLVKGRGKDPEVFLLLARVNFQKDNFEKAEELADEIVSIASSNNATLAGAAEIYAYLGYIEKSQDIFKMLLQEKKVSHQVMVQYASAMQIWGAFYEAAKFYEDHIHNHPHDEKAKIAYGWLLVSTERIAEGETVFLKLIREKQNEAGALERLAQAMIFAKNYTKAHMLINRLLEKDPDELKWRMMQAKNYYASGDTETAIKLYWRLTRYPSQAETAYIGLAECYLKLKNYKASKKAAEEALKYNSKSLAGFFYKNFTNKKMRQKILESTFNGKYVTSRLYYLADLFAQNNESLLAIKIYHKILNRNPHFYPAKFALAQIYGGINQFDKSLKLLYQIQKKYPENYKLLLWLARVNSWEKNYDASIYYYDKMLKIMPDDPVPLREKARVSFWSKNPSLGLKSYNKELTPSVDCLLKEKLDQLSIKNLDSMCNSLKKKIKDKKLPYCFYETLKENYRDKNFKLTYWSQAEIEDVLIDLTAKYQLQKSFYLEKKAKLFVYEQDTLHAIHYYQKLLEFEPGNDEALFDLGQNYCHLGIKKQAVDTYKKLLSQNSTHNLARGVLEREEILAGPFVAQNWHYFEDEGRGDLDRIIQHLLQTSIGTTFYYSHLVSAFYKFYMETPTFWEETKIYDRKDLEQTVLSDAYGISYRGKFSPYLQLNLNFAQKFYRHDKFKDEVLGEIQIENNLYDYARLSYGFRRKDQIDNYFCFRHNIASNTIWGEFVTSPFRWLEFDLTGRWMIYSDSNRMEYHTLDTQVTFTNDPYKLSAFVSLEYRDSREQNIYTYTANDYLVDIVHPYWTPVDYKAYSVALRWRQNLMVRDFCGGKQHYFIFEIRAGSDTEKNDFYKLWGLWNYDITNRFSFSFSSYIHRSVIWNANDVQINLSYRF